MKLRNLKIANYRGVKSLNWSIPDIPQICLIGSGDSNKSTILEAISLVFSPYWNPKITDNDFHNCDPSQPIQIFATIGNLPEEFISRFDFGDNLSGWNIATNEYSTEPKDDEGWELALKVRFSVGADLEPKWSVVREDHDEGRDFKTADRTKANVSLVGHDRDIHLTWSRYSVLDRITEKQVVTSPLAIAGRAAKEALCGQRDQIANLDEAAGVAEAAARELGIQVNTGYQAHLDLAAIQLRQGGLGLHDGNVPIHQLGLGSKRMLIGSLQGKVKEGHHITLFDEIEVGLEPNRIARLLKTLADDAVGQFIMTTHSPVVLRELGVENLFVVHASTAETKIIPAAQEHIKNNLQGNIRLAAEAFLASKVIVCEGATEVGFLRGLDQSWVKEKELSCSYHGVTFLDARGASKIEGIVKDLNLMQYNSCVFADADDESNFSKATRNTLSTSGTKVIVWADSFCLEQRVFNDLPWEGVVESLRLAQTLGNNAIVANVGSAIGRVIDTNIESWEDAQDLRNAIGKAAKLSEWFKRTDRGEAWAILIFPYVKSEEMVNSDLSVKVSQLRHWISDE
ncbi:ATP-dependent nuclease [Hellea balneolensis]|uniref:ATP-dependent nuclease n=1 Tax=Hellea balneolensis TaxID=287478 RepID=UPI00041DDDEB|nr:ATP-binding protein [Hellea balneolensis]